METAQESALHLQDRRTQLVKTQLQKITKMAVDGLVVLPLTDEAVRTHLDDNFRFYFGTLTRRNHNLHNSLAGPLSPEVVENEYMAAAAHIGYMVNRRAVDLLDARVSEPHTVEVDAVSDAQDLISV